ncbi:MAG: hypothetical protein ACLQQ4_13035 [Bacteroidia bacterium]
MKKGNCFEANYKAILKKPFNRGWYLCHGIVTGQGGNVKGVQYVHAWLENDETVFDHSNGKVLIMLKADYYRIGNIVNVVRYSVSEALEMALEVGTYGCWDKLFDKYL